MKTKWLAGWMALLLVISTGAFAGSPVAMLQGVANKMVSELQQNQSRLKDKAVIHRIVNQVLVPNIDINRMAGMVVGRQNWYSASPALRQEFVRQFKQVVINTYANALSSFDDDKVKVYPVRGGAPGRFVSVKSVIIRKSGQKIPISYKLIKQSGRWKVYDFSIEGISIVENYRSQFAGTLANGGMQVLVQKLQRFNQR